MAKMTHFVSAKLSYSMLIGGYKQSGGEKALNQRQTLAPVLA